MKVNRKIAVYGLSVATSVMLFTGCAAIQNTNNTTKGAAIGTAAGAGLGALIGGKAGNTAVGAIAGAAIGGVAGGLIGKKMDRQAKEIENTVAGAEVIKADEGIIVKFDEGILFDFNSSTLKSAAKDNIGTLAANQKVSESRANAVKAYAVSQGLSSGRIKTEGKNYSEPIASNDTDAGRAENRRVEIVIVAGDQMIQEAQSEAGR